jgi:hypothetical protein
MIALVRCMISATKNDSPRIQQAGQTDDISVQPSSLPSPAAGAVGSSMVPTAEPIPTQDLPAASPWPDKRREQTRGAGSHFWWPALIITVLAGIVLLAFLSNNRARDVRDPAGKSPAGAVPADPSRSP